jgi:hypothetical protein
LADARLAGEGDADRATVVVHIDVELLAEGTGAAVMEDGPALARETARRLVCDCRWQPVVHGPDGRPAGVGTTQRTVAPWLVRQLRHRDQGCVFPGCGRTRWVQAHHRVHHADGGPTTLDNLELLCLAHHHLVHEGGWRITRPPGGSARFYRPDGRPYTTGPPPLAADLRRRLHGDDAA